MEITKRDDLAKDLAATARNLLNAYLAVDANQRGLTYGDTMTETEIARQVGVDFGSSYPYRIY